ncbi:MAG: 2-oxoacid:acceptor oxidoreductase subunit alpha [Propionibacteriaceae bacterium]|nr:2-oxoacid:acceptor oxidoreductase subunit alpha [Propionibacteriaceae bacterium]
MVAAPVQQVDDVVIRFAGDSGDGLQLTGERFTVETAVAGNNLLTLPDYPAEIRSPAGTVAGVSSFQIHFGGDRVTTPGSQPDVLVAFNPAALQAHRKSVRPGGLIIVDRADFTTRNLAKAGFDANPLEDGTLANWQVVALDLTGQAQAAAAPFGLSRKDAARTRNMLALGLISWLFSRPVEPTEDYLTRRFANRPAVRDANLAALRAGHAFGETADLFAVRYQVAPAPWAAGVYRHVNGNQALAYGLMAGAHLAGLPLFCGSYPITPASEILQELSAQTGHGVTVFQAEDEIAGAGSALGASFGGALGVTTTSGPGLALITETVNLAVMAELPLVVVDVQRGGPSTGLPTKVEQADLNQALFGRPGESPLAVVAPRSPADCFDQAVQACRLAVAYRMPVIVLSDAYLANGAEPWRVPDLAALAPIEPRWATEPNGVDAAGQPCFEPYRRDPATLARDWARPGTPGLEHRIGGLEKAPSGAISYDPDNHEAMIQARAAKVAGAVRDVPDVVVDDPDGAQVLALGWGSTYGAVWAAVDEARQSGAALARAHLSCLSPLPANLAAVLGAYRRVVVPELNLGQLAAVLRSLTQTEIDSYPWVRGQPLAAPALAEHLRAAAAAVGSAGPTAAPPAPADDAAPQP